MQYIYNFCRHNFLLPVSDIILQSTVTVMECVGELSELMQDLPDYCDYFMSMLIRILEDYRNTSHQSYQGLKCGDLFQLICVMLILLGWF